MSKIKCYHCGEFGNFKCKCPKFNKSKSVMTAITEDLSHITCHRYREKGCYANKCPLTLKGKNNNMKKNVAKKIEEQYQMCQESEK